MSELRPGPWRAYESHIEPIEGLWSVKDAHGLRLVAHVDETTARLIAAAPELLEAAKQVVQEFDPLDEFVSAPKPIVDLKAAIDKAEGSA